MKKYREKHRLYLAYPIVAEVVVVVDLIKDVTELKTFIEKLTVASRRCSLIMEQTLYTPQKTASIVYIHAINVRRALFAMHFCPSFIPVSL